MAPALPILGLVAQIGGGVMQAVGAVNEGEAAAQAAEYNASQARQNAALSLQQSAEEERRLRVMGQKDIGAARAAYGASGVSADSGSVMDVIGESAANAERDALTARQGGQQKASMFMQESDFYKRGGANARSNSYLKAAGSLLGTGASAADSYTKLKRK